ncbi:MAG: N-acetyltransferase [Erythrobacter sp.]|nr:N-acetyltransferase [Erythrobacter sp.]
MIREERRGDEAAVRQLVAAAFADEPHSDGSEPEIMDRLRRDGTPMLSLVADQGGVILGHVAFSPVTIGGADCHWFGLAPLSVAPARQKRGIGTALVREGLRRLAEQGAKGCVVLGDPAYYGRFGFAADADISYPGVPPEYFQRLLLAGDMPRGAVRYAPAFG